MPRVAANVMGLLPSSDVIIQSSAILESAAVHTDDDAKAKHLSQFLED